MKLVKFNKAGKWADPDTLIPQIEVEINQKIEVSDKLADLVIGSGNGEIVVIPLTDEEQKERDAENTRLAEEADANRDVVSKLQAAEKEVEKLTATNAELTVKLKDLAENIEIGEMELAELKANLEKMEKPVNKTPASKDKGKSESK